jgi:Cu/Zn superoxide dismutase
VTKAIEANKNVSEARLANASRNINDVRKELPDVVVDPKDNLKSSTQLNQMQSSAILETVDELKQVMSSTIHRKQAQEWAAVTNANTIKHAATTSEDMTQSVGNNVSNIAGSAETVASSAGVVAGSMKRVTESMERATKEVEGIHVIGKSLVDRIDHYGRFMQMSTASFAYQAQQAVEVLTNISEHLGDQNSISVSGSGGPNSFARPVYDFVQTRIDETDSKNQ